MGLVDQDQPFTDCRQAVLSRWQLHAMDTSQGTPFYQESSDFFPRACRQATRMETTLRITQPVCSTSSPHRRQICGQRTPKILQRRIEFRTSAPIVAHVLRKNHE
jgi:hypothetical protein